MLAEMENDVSERNLEFKVNKKLADFQTEITGLGRCKGTDRSLGLSHKGGNES